ncbi:MAG: (Fe-S)-binding protein [Calditrichaeota bacterium]|nr:(Fe-S)-binding protein [Calditrichota bacterium]MBT7788839.1 (Fe-S)-binding protein [Calditrichota bacterium]
MKKLPLHEIASRSEELDKCVTCGLCQSVCPTFIADGHEGKTARGKIILLRGLLDGSLSPTSSIADIFDDCLTCYACQTVCPAGVKTERLWTSARFDLAEKSSSTRKKRIGLRWTIGKPALFNILVRIAGKFGFDPDKPESVNLHNRIVLPFKGAPLLDSLEEEYLPEGSPVGTVAMLVGCSGNLFAPNVVKSSIRLLTAFGWRVIIPKDQVCCGAPAINNQDWKTARKLALKNMDVFLSLDVDRVTSPDATCTGAIMKDYKEIFRSDEIVLSHLKKLASKTAQLSEVLGNYKTDIKPAFRVFKSRVTLHDSCHSTHLTGGSGWRKLLNKIEGLEIIEMQESDHCCGFGGSYSLFHRETAMKIADRKLSNSVKTGAELVLVGSPGCLIWLNSAKKLVPSGNLKIQHVSELISNAIC